MASKSIKAILTLKDKNFSSNMKKASGGVNSFNRRLKHSSNQVKKFKRNATSSFKSVAKSAVGLAAGYLGFRALSNGISSSIEAAKVQISVEKKLETVLKQRTKATDAQLKSIYNLTASQQGLGIIGDEIQIAGAQQIGTFVKSTKSVEALIPAMNNLLAQQKGVNATQQDAVNIGNMVGKVMQGQVGALTRVGVTFTKAQEKALKYGTESERAAMLAKVITGNVGEMNKALAETDEGKIQNMTNSWGDYKEEIGKKILPLQAKFAGWFAKKIPGIQSFTLKAINKGVKAFDKVGSVINKVKEKMLAVKQWGVDAWIKIKGVIDENRPTLDKVKVIIDDIKGGLITLKDKFVNAFKNEGVSWFKDKALPAITEGILGVIDKAADLYNFFKDNWSTIEPIVLGIAGAIGAYKLAIITTTAVTKGASMVTKGMTLAQKGLNLVINMSPLGKVALLIGVAVGAGVALYKNWDTIKACASSLWGKIKSVFSGIKNTIGGVIENIKEGISSGINNIKEKFINFKDFIKGIAGACVNLFTKPINKMIGGINKISISIPDRKIFGDLAGKEFGFNIKKLPEYSTGTSYFKGGLARINEHNKGEIVNLPNGAQVIPADKSEQLINNTQNISGLDGLLKLLHEIMRVLKEMGKVKKGDIIININGSNMTVEEVANELVPKIKLALANS